MRFSPRSLFRDSEQIKPVQIVGQAVDLSLCPSSKLLAITPEGYSRRQSKVFTGRALGVGLFQVHLRQVGRASTNTGRFRVGGNRCWPRLARFSLRKRCCRSCYSHLVREPEWFWCFANFGPWRRTFIFILQELVMAVLPVLIAIFWLFIGLWIREGHQSKSACSEVNPVPYRS